MTIELFLPGLLAVPGRFLEMLPSDIESRALAVALQRSRCQRTTAGRFGPLAEWLAVPRAPLAAMQWLAVSDEAPPEHLALLTPTHFQAGMSDLVVMPPSLVNVTDEERQRLGKELQEFFGNEPVVHLHGSDWFIEIPPAISSTPLHAVIGKSLREFLPTGEDAQRVNAWLNEMQMLLHGSTVNTERDAAGMPAINGMWLWGEGSMPVTLPQAIRHAQVAGRGRSLQLARGVAMAVDGTFVGDGMPDKTIPDDASLYVIDTTAVESLDADDIAAWQSACDDMLSRWLEPALNKLRTGQRDVLRLYPGDGYAYELTRGRLRAFWRDWFSGKWPRKWPGKRQLQAEEQAVGYEESH